MDFREIIQNRKNLVKSSIQSNFKESEGVELQKAKASPPGTINKWGEMKMGDGTWKYVGKQGHNHPAALEMKQKTKNVSEGKELTSHHEQMLRESWGEKGTYKDSKEFLDYVRDNDSSDNDFKDLSDKQIQDWFDRNEGVENSYQNYTQEHLEKLVKKSKPDSKHFEDMNDFELKKMQGFTNSNLYNSGLDSHTKQKVKDWNKLLLSEISSRK